jgi:outer membrane immunogenic protein
MKKLAIGAIVGLIGTPVLAADLGQPVYQPAPPPPAPVYSWAGFYAGGQIGGAWSNSDYTLNNGAGLIESFNFNPDSVIGDGNVGIQGQWANWVLGIEGTFNWTNLTQTDQSVSRALSVVEDGRYLQWLARPDMLGIACCST